MKFLSVFIIVLCSFTLSCIHKSDNKSVKDEWLLVGYSDHSPYYIRSKSITDKPYIKVWTKQFKVRVDIDGDTYLNVTIHALAEFDCDKKRFKTLRAIYYDHNDNAIMEDNSEEEWRDVAPQSIGEKLSEKACGLFR